MKVGDDELASLRRAAEGFDGVISAVLKELFDLRTVAVAARRVADTSEETREGEHACVILEHALMAAGYR